MDNTPRINGVKPLPGNHLEIVSENGIKKDYDCHKVMNRPEFFLLSDELFFRSVKVDIGGYGISWNDNYDKH